MPVFAILDEDIVVGRLEGSADGVPIPAPLLVLPDARLRLFEGAIIDASGITDWHIDARGFKHATPAAGRQAITSAWDAQLIRDGGVWRARTLQDALSPRIRAECQRRIYAVASPNTQMNMTAARADGRLSAPDAVSYAAALDWVAAMRTRCATLIADGASDWLSDEQWIPVPPAVADLAQRF
jgi:hypothetical protein